MTKVLLPLQLQSLHDCRGSTEIMPSHCAAIAAFKELAVRVHLQNDIRNYHTIQDVKIPQI